MLRSDGNEKTKIEEYIWGTYQIDISNIISFTWKHLKLLFAFCQWIITACFQSRSKKLIFMSVVHLNSKNKIWTTKYIIYKIQQKKQEQLYWRTPFYLCVCYMLRWCNFLIFFIYSIWSARKNIEIEFFNFFVHAINKK